MPTTNVIGPIDSASWRSMIHARGAIDLFRKDGRTEALEKYEWIYKDTLRPFLDREAA